MAFLSLLWGSLAPDEIILFFIIISIVDPTSYRNIARLCNCCRLVVAIDAGICLLVLSYDMIAPAFARLIARNASVNSAKNIYIWLSIMYCV